MENKFTKEVKKHIYLTEDDIKILEKYEISYQDVLNMKELIFRIEDIINNNFVFDDLENLLIKLTEYNYYFDTNK